MTLALSGLIIEQETIFKHYRVGSSAAAQEERDRCGGGKDGKPGC